MIAENIIQQLGLIQPGRVSWREARPPPLSLQPEVLRCSRSGVAGVPILNQKHALQSGVSLSKVREFLDIVLGIFLIDAGGLHPTGMDNQKHQHVNRPMAYIFELLLFDRTGNGPPKGVTFQGLEVGNLIHADDPNSLLGQTVSIGVAPQNLLGSLFEPVIQTHGLPIPGSMRLQVHRVQNATNGTGTDVRYDPIGHGLAGQVLTGPMGDVQPLGDRFKTGQLDDLSPLQGGKSAGDVLTAELLTTGARHRLVHNGDSCARQWTGHIACAKLPPESVHPLPPLIPYGRAGPDTKVRFDFALRVEEGPYRG